MKARNLVIAILAVSLIIVIYKVVSSSNESKALFPLDGVDLNTIEKVEIYEPSTNITIHVTDKEWIEKFSFILADLKSDNITSMSANDEDGLYVLYITNTGYYPVGMGVYTGSISLRDKKINIPPDKSASLIQLLKDEIDNQ